MRMVPCQVRLVILAIAAVGAAACSDQAPTAPALGSRANADLASGHGHRNVIIMKDGAASMAALTAQVRSLGGQVVRTQPDINIVTVSGLSDAAAAVIANRSDVDGVQQDSSIRMIPPREQMIGRLVHVEADQSGAFFFPAFQWNMRQIKADKAWLVTNQGSGSLVCVLDTGIDPDHLDLQGKVDLNVSTSFVASEPDIIDHNFHGTFVSTLISSNGIGIASVAPNARLCMIKVLDANGQGNFSDLIAGIMYAAKHKADVINMSLGAYVSIRTKADVQLVVALQRAINFAVHHGTVPVAAAGNDTVNLATDSPRNLSIPAQLLGVIDVGATAPVNQQNFDQITTYSNFGFPGVLVFAPGGDLVAGGVTSDLIISACAGSAVPGCADEQTYLLGAGTSFSSPHVAGEAAVIGSDFKHDPKVNKVTACIELTSDHPTGRFIDPLYGFGRIDVLNAAICMKH
jgi:subtilisin family serine protease